MHIHEEIKPYIYRRNTRNFIRKEHVDIHIFIFYKIGNILDFIGYVWLQHIMLKRTKNTITKTKTDDGHIFSIRINRNR